MILKCISNITDSYSNQRAYVGSGHSDLQKNILAVGLTVNKYYIPYAIFKEKKEVFYLVEDDGKSRWPNSYHSSFFTLIDPIISRYFNRSTAFDNSSIDVLEPEFEWKSFPEWENDKNFYHRIYEGEAVPNTFTEEEALSAIDTFKRYKPLMDLEFAMPDVTTFAEYSGKGNWLLCPKCIDAWEEPYINIHEMVKCPKCENTFLNPVKIDANKMLP